MRRGVSVALWEYLRYSGKLQSRGCLADLKKGEYVTGEPVGIPAEDSGG